MTVQLEKPDAPVAAGRSVQPGRVPKMKRQRREAEQQERTNLSPIDRQQLRVRVSLRITTVVLLTFLALISAGPMLWLAKSAVSTTEDIVQRPFALWPSGIQWGNLPYAWEKARIGTYMINT